MFVHKDLSEVVQNEESEPVLKIVREWMTRTNIRNGNSQDLNSHHDLTFHRNGKFSRQIILVELLDLS